MCHDALKSKRGGSRTNADPLQHVRMTADKMYYRFIVAFDSGSETGSNQLTVWVAEESDIDAVPLKRFGVAQLLNSLTRLERSPLLAKLEEEMRDLRCRNTRQLQSIFASTRKNNVLASPLCWPPCHRCTSR